MFISSFLLRTSAVPPYAVDAIQWGPRIVVFEIIAWHDLENDNALAEWQKPKAFTGLVS